VFSILYLTLFLFLFLHFQILGGRLEASNLDVQTGTRQPFEFHFQGAPQNSYLKIIFYSEFFYYKCIFNFFVAFQMNAN